MNMDGMLMPTSSKVAMAMSTAMATAMTTATASSSDSFALHAMATEAASAGAGSGSMGQSASMGMGGMASYLHFGVGDAFIAPFLTPAETSAYVGVMFLLMLLAVLQRLLLPFTAMMNHKLSAHVQPSYQAEQDRKSESWIQIDEDIRPAEDLATRLKVSIPRAIARSLLQVLNAAVGFLVMLGVMTLNAGYILALLAGVFLAEFALSLYKHSHPAAY